MAENTECDHPGKYIKPVGRFGGADIYQCSKCGSWEGAE